MTKEEKTAYINEWRNNKARYMARFNDNSNKDKNKQYVYNTSSK